MKGSFQKPPPLVQLAHPQLSHFEIYSVVFQKLKSPYLLYKREKLSEKQSQQIFILQIRTVMTFQRGTPAALWWKWNAVQQSVTDWSRHVKIKKNKNCTDVNKPCWRNGFSVRRDFLHDTNPEFVGWISQLRTFNTGTDILYITECGRLRF